MEMLIIDVNKKEGETPTAVQKMIEKIMPVLVDGESSPTESLLALGICFAAVCEMLETMHSDKDLDHKTLAREIFEEGVKSTKLLEMQRSNSSEP